MGFGPGSLSPQPKGLKRNPRCRLFLVHADGSGLELLSSQTVEEGLHQARSDPAVALLKEPLPDSGAPFRGLPEVPNNNDVCVFFRWVWYHRPEARSSESVVAVDGGKKGP